MLALKLLVVPLFLGLISLAGRRWGPGVAGWLAGFPVVGGPILLFLALENGTGFAAQAAIASLSAVAATVTFNLSYSWLCRRNGRSVSVALGLSAWAAAIVLLGQLPSILPIALSAALVALLAAPWLFPRMAEAPRQRPLPHSELFFRMAAGVVLTLVVTAVAAGIGSMWSGLVTVFPVLGVVLALFAHKSNGPAYVITLLRSMIRGLYAFAAFTFAVALLLPAYGILPSFCAAVAFCILLQWAAGAVARFAVSAG